MYIILICSFYIIAKIFFAYATLASFLLQFYVPMDFLEPVILDGIARTNIKFLVQVLFRSVVVLFIGKYRCNYSCFNYYYRSLPICSITKAILTNASIVIILVTWKSMKNN